MQDPDGSTTVLEFQDIRGNQISLTFDHFKDPERVKKNLCGICGSLYKQAVRIIRLQTDPDAWMKDEEDQADSKTPRTSPSSEDGDCGHTFCRQCLASGVEASETDPHCPYCRLELGDETGRVIKATDIRTDIADLKASCVYRDKGCTWVGELGQNTKSYLAHIESCAHRGKQCQTCDEVIDWAVVSSATPHRCPNETIICHEACVTGVTDAGCKADRVDQLVGGTEMKYSDITHMVSGTEGAKVVKVEGDAKHYEIGCGKKMKRKELSKHLEICENRPTTCWYGCKGKFSIKSIPHHNKMETEKHLAMFEKKTLTEKAATAFKIKTLKAELKDLKESKEQLESQVNDLKEANEEFTNTKVNFSCTLGVFHLNEWHRRTTNTFLLNVPSNPSYLPDAKMTIEVFNYMDPDDDDGIGYSASETTEFKLRINFTKPVEDEEETLFTLSILNHKYDSHDFTQSVLLGNGEKSFTLRFLVSTEILNKMLCEDDILSFALCYC